MSLQITKPDTGSINNGGPVEVNPWYVPVVSGTGFNGDFLPITTTAAPLTGVGAAMAACRVLIAYPFSFIGVAVKSIICG